MYVGLIVDVAQTHFVVRPGVMTVKIWDCDSVKYVQGLGCQHKVHSLCSGTF